MIYLKRSIDFYKEVTWVANELDEIAKKNRALYVGGDVNGAIEAAIKAGLSRPDAEVQARAEIERCKSDLNDEIKV